MQQTHYADYQGPRSKQFDADLKNGISASSAAKTILDGIKNNTPRIFVSDGFLHDALARLLPASYHHIIALYMKIKKLKTD
ncbi:MAG: hypothetical protein IPP60_00520 [Sphingobacteriales bacterium]|nr:hypothetical protein [Sphingobacteriales bacterium]